MPEPPPLVALLLAAGESTRLGRPKQLVLHRGEPLLRRAVRVAAAVGATPVFVVTNPSLPDCRAMLSDLPATVLVNPLPAAGMGSSLRLGMEAVLAAQPERLLLLVCDQPLLGPEHLGRLLRAPAPGGVAAAAYGGRAGVPAVFSQEHFPALAQLSGDQGARGLLRTLPATPVPMPEAAIDIDTPEDLAALWQQEAATPGR